MGKLTIAGTDVKLVLQHGSREDACPGLHVALAALQVGGPGLAQHGGAHGHQRVIGRKKPLLLCHGWCRHAIRNMVPGVGLQGSSTGLAQALHEVAERASQSSHRLQEAVSGVWMPVRSMVISEKSWR